MKELLNMNTCIAQQLAAAALMERIIGLFSLKPDRILGLAQSMGFPSDNVDALLLFKEKVAKVFEIGLYNVVSILNDRPPRKLNDEQRMIASLFALHESTLVTHFENEARLHDDTTASEIVYYYISVMPKIISSVFDSALLMSNKAVESARN